MVYNSHKTNGRCNNHNYKYFTGNHLSKLRHIPDPHRLSYTNYRITLVSSTYINYCCNYFTAVLCAYIIVLYLFRIKQLFTNLFSWSGCSLSNKGYRYTCICALVVAKQWWQKPVRQPTFGPVSLKHVFILVNNPIHRCNILYWQVYFRQVKATNDTTTLLARFLYNTIFYWLTDLAIGTTFSSCKHFSLWKILCKQMCLLGYALFLIIW